MEGEGGGMGRGGGGFSIFRRGEGGKEGLWPPDPRSGIGLGGGGMSLSCKEEEF